MGKKNSREYRYDPYSQYEYSTDVERMPVYGSLVLDEEQKAFRDAIWNENYTIVFCDAKAGTGKTQIATAFGNLLVQSGRYDGLVYIAAPTQEQKQGYIKGSLEEKSEPYFEPFYQALAKIGVNRNSAMVNDINNVKEGTGYIECLTHTFQRGCNFENKVVIIDEAQNFYVDELRKVLTRMHDSCKVIVIGHTGQIDLYKHPNRSGFSYYIEHFRGKEHSIICTLVNNHRGWLSSWADEIETTIARIDEEQRRPKSTGTSIPPTP